ncbi:MAG: phytanoyl-CoA dioxygenase family protein [Planctomycetota bacterium]|jgi:ectoine hydroxylase-related dioxygenase (phytanoyl-CoA dioxygenase family)|nr:phytanoyl-CoA dioxygenase family protein [Planctomycetota bacterium]MDP7129062.1 phytanoyl-CoA dioxygenase family protein [Planctomycetota bacterium]MDP7248618.1 phytanoyl-CoA dioxygenase family protein [Planctomycetota bacterium]
MNSESATESCRYSLEAGELAQWNRDGYFVRENVFTAEENDAIRQAAEDVVVGDRAFPSAHMDRNALVTDGKEERKGIYGMHKIHHPSCYLTAFLDRARDERLTDPLLDVLGSDILGINNLFIWKAPEIGLGFPWHQDKFYFRRRFTTETTVGTWTAIDPADRDNGCLYVIPGSHKWDIREHDDLDGSQQKEFKLARGVRDEDGVPVEIPPGAVIWFHSHLLHKSTDNHSQRFRRCYVIHYLSAQAEWADPGLAGRRGQPVMWIRGRTFPGKVCEVERTVLSILE